MHAGKVQELKTVTLTDYDPEWAEHFVRLASRLREGLGDIAAEIEHVGSTAVPGLAAKPIIDLDIVVGSSAEVGLVRERLESIGYRSKGTRGIPGREAFDQPPGCPPHYLYVVVSGSKPHLDHVLLRELLRARPELASRYEEVKRANAYRLPHDRLGYTDAKAEVITELLALAWTDAGVAHDDAIHWSNVTYRWRELLDDAAVDELHTDAFGADAPVYRWRRARPLSLGWVSATERGRLVGFTNVAWDGDRHAFLLDVAVATDRRRQGIGRHLVERAIEEVGRANCEWLHVDYEPDLAGFYAACGFTSSLAGLVRLTR
jgi:GrpB-like predicted nucleotidyltransferase (UPF0157 family)/predicted N-acetyltransferase YhbS